MSDVDVVCVGQVKRNGVVHAEGTVFRMDADEAALYPWAFTVLREAQPEPESEAAESEAAEELTAEAVEKMGVKELKEALKARGEAVSGNKSDLVDRLLSSITEEE